MTDQQRDTLERMRLDPVVSGDEYFAEKKRLQDLDTDTLSSTERAK